MLLGWFVDRLMIEQILMKSIKNIGGLTRGRGMEESERALWILSMSARASYSDARRQLKDAFKKEAPHKDLTETRMLRDSRDEVKYYSI